MSSRLSTGASSTGLRTQYNNEAALFNPKYSKESLYNRCRIREMNLPCEINDDLEVFSHPTKGRGVRARQEIIAGTIILLEKPMISKLARLPKSSFESRLKGRVQVLSLSDRKLFVQLAPNYDDFCQDQEYSRMKANAFDTTQADGNVTWNLYRYMCFINHSCVPNSSVRIDEQDRVEVRALIDIDVGTEIEFDYIPDISHDPSKMFEADKEFRYRSVSRRRKIIKERWGFDCHCKACEDAGEIDPMRRDANLLDRFLRPGLPEPWTESFGTLRDQFEAYVAFLEKQRIFCKVPAVCKFLIRAYDREARDGRMTRQVHQKAVLRLLKTIADACQAEYGQESRMCGKATEAYEELAEAWTVPTS
ncbi:hypothetical protein FKW77_006476 [Venturia effusa]|uniref:SET domain-containing protein n=1 Tax=Venturia effusa TaxID=50376 RepID=A0A517LLP6_9PEZI|nr:hypothetical protein FKW77_006476 [Venturia effusa]